MTTNPGSASAGLPPPRRRGRKRLIAAVGLIVLGVQSWALARNAGRLRLVVYNDGHGPMADAALVCGEQVAALGELAMEESRQSWFSTPERSAVVIFKWTDGTGPHEASWSAERGERLTVRVGPEGDASITRELSVGRLLWNAVAEP